MPDPTIRLTSTGIAVHRFKFQNWCSSAEVVMKIRLIVSQICQATDRTSTELLLIRAIANLVLEFRAVSFPWPALRKGFEQFLKKHPYLNAVRKGLVHGLQTESLCNLRSSCPFKKGLFASGVRPAFTSSTGSAPLSHMPPQCCALVHFVLK